MKLLSIKSLSMKTQILMLTLALVTVSLGFLAVLTVTQMKAEMHKDNDRRAISIISILSRNVGPGIEIEDTSYVREIVMAAFDDKDILGICVCGSDDNTLFYHSSDSRLHILEIDCPPPDTLIVTHKDNMVVVSSAIMLKNKVVGDIWLALSEESMYARIHSIIIYMVGLSLLVLLIVFVAGSLIASKIVNPIISFEKAAKRIQEGDMVTAIDISPLNKDFIPLGMAFNKMSVGLDTAFDELKATRQNLEAQVEIRTSELKNELGERKKAEQALKQSQQKLELHIQQTPLAVIQWDLDFKVVEWNNAAERIFGYTANDAIGIDATELIIPGSAKKEVNNVWKSLLQQKGGTRSTNENNTKNGDTVLCDWYNTPLIDNDGATIGVASLVMDITEKFKAEESLKEQAAFAFNNPAPIMQVTLEGIIRNFNPGAKQIFGEAINHVLISEILPSLLKPILKSISEGEIYQFEQKISEQYFLFHVKYDLPTNSLYIYGTDITDNKHAEEHQQKLKEELERVQRMESLGILAGGVAHDLNNMLGPLVGYPELILLKLPQDSPLRKQVERIGRSARDAADVIQDLLTLARRGRYEMEPTNLVEVVETYLDSPSYRKLAEERTDIELKCDFEDNQLFIFGSAPHLAKVVMNLIVNATDAMAVSGNLNISIERKSIDKLFGGYKKIEPGDYVILRVRDTGSGIDAEDMDKIFEPYYSKKKMGTSGSGLGLSVVYGIVKDHHGYYDIFSTKGQGTEFVLYFSAIDKPPDAIEEITNEIGGQETILIVDDTPEQREIASEFLLNLGYKVVTAENGHKAIDYLTTNKVDLVLMDMIMEKDFDGLDTYREILKIHPGQKAVIVSGFSATERVDEMLSLGAGAYVKKPFTFTSLSKAIRDELDRPVRSKASV